MSLASNLNDLLCEFFALMIFLIGDANLRLNKFSLTILEALCIFLLSFKGLYGALTHCRISAFLLSFIPKRKEWSFFLISTDLLSYGSENYAPARSAREVLIGFLLFFESLVSSLSEEVSFVYLALEPKNLSLLIWVLPIKKAYL